MTATAFDAGVVAVPFGILVVILSAWIVRQYLRKMEATAGPPTLFGGGDGE